MTPELSCLLAAISCAVRGPEQTDRLVGLEDPQFLRKVVALALQTKSFSFVGQCLSQDHPHVDAEFIHHTHRRFKIELIARNTKLLNKTSAVSNALSEHKIQHVIIKGPLQQKQIHSDYFVRSCSDVDILVSYGDYKRSIRHLSRALNLSVINTSPFFWWDVFVGERHLVPAGARDWSIDLHHRVQAPGSPQPRSTDAMLDSSVPHTLMDSSIPVLAPGYLPILSALSIAKAFRRHELSAGHVVDLYAVVSRLSDRELADTLELAERQGLGGTMNLALATAAACFGGPSRTHSEFSLPCPAELLPAMAFTPVAISRWPSTNEWLRYTARGPNANYLRERAWFALSEVSRKLEKIVTLAKRPRDHVAGS